MNIFIPFIKQIREIDYISLLGDSRIRLGKNHVGLGEIHSFVCLYQINNEFRSNIRTNPRCATLTRG